MAQKASKQSQNQTDYHLNNTGEFVIKNYNFAKPMANFFPGIAGKYGTPLWVFYVNRGQGINSFGIDGKDTPILEFYPANKAWQTTSILGFRTFIKVADKKSDILYEPFRPGALNSSFEIENQMGMTSYDFNLKETNKTLGLETKVDYFTIPQDSYAALVRTVTIKNTSKKPQKLQILDGLPQIVCFGIHNWFLKEMSRTIEAWIVIDNLDKGVPFYKIDVDPGDRPQVLHIEKGNFLLGMMDNKIIKPIVDPDAIFSTTNDFSYPHVFANESNFSYPAYQQTICKTPCGFLLVDMQLKPGEEKSFFEVIGNARNKELLNSYIKPKVNTEYITAKKEENKKLIQELQNDIKTHSSSWEFDYYCKQTYLDNIMRGGYPAIFNYNDKRTVFYLYSRKHGDLERDYNRYQIQPSYFSQGNGNYRDINQNRRCDIWFNPKIEDFNIANFINLIQTDGHNPLVVKGASFILEEVDEFKTKSKNILLSKDLEKLLPLVQKAFSPGQLMIFIEENNIKLNIPKDDFLSLLLAHCSKNPEAEHGEGYWIDHWHYNLDLIDAYLGVYPENKENLVFQKKDFTYFDNDAIVQPRKNKFVLYENLPKQLHSVCHDDEKKSLIHKRKTQPHTSRAKQGLGEIYKTTLINKLLCLFVNKMSSLDPFGTGIEMDSEKPNWYDALNGLPALFGSSSCEAFELKRLIIFIKESFEQSKISSIALTEEIAEFLQDLGVIIEQHLSSKETNKDYIFWDKTGNLKESYRKKTKCGFTGTEIEVKKEIILNIINNALTKLDTGLKKTYDNEKSFYYGYFINEVVEFDKISDAHIMPKKFKQIRLPFFLEGQMHGLRLAKDSKHCKELYEGTKKSDVYDKKLKMYKVTASLNNMPEEIGRSRNFPSGWLENESVFLHMEYKYMLEVLKHGLNEEFYSDFKNVLIPFQKPEQYGRSILENSSFIASSTFVNKNLHGNGFVARLSGSTVEFINMWLIMNLGKEPFFLNNKKELNFKIAPQLAGWLFSEKEKTYSFNLFSKILVTYHNPKRKNTFGVDGVKVEKIVLTHNDGSKNEFFSDTLESIYAKAIRNQEVSSIDVYFK